MHDAARVADADRVLQQHRAIRLEHEVDADDPADRLAGDRIAVRHLHVVLDAGHQRGQGLDELGVLVHLEHGRERVHVRARDLIEIDRRLAELVLAEQAPHRGAGADVDRDVAVEAGRGRDLVGVAELDEHRIVGEHLVGAVELHERGARRRVEVADRPLDRDLDVVDLDVRQRGAELGRPRGPLLRLLCRLEPARQHVLRRRDGQDALGVGDAGLERHRAGQVRRIVRAPRGEGARRRGGKKWDPSRRARARRHCDRPHG